MADWTPLLTPTGIGTLPLDDPEAAVDLILARLPEVPFWPQLSPRGPWEDMVLQTAPGLPLMAIDLDNRRVTVDPDQDRAQALTEFYEADLGGDHDRFGLTEEVAPGYFSLNRRLEADSGRLVRQKGHVTGPITFCLAAKDQEGRDVIHDPELSQAIARGIGLKGAWQAAHFTPSGQPGLIFLDEPALTGFGSAFMSLSKEAAAELLELSIGPIKAAGALAAIHICGNTDWSLALESSLDLINFDAFGFGEGFLLYPKQISAFFERGGGVAWGIVPTAEFTGQETIDGLSQKLDRLITSLARQTGLNRHTVMERSLVTPSCGMGSLSPEAAVQILDLTAGVSAKLRG